MGFPRQEYWIGLPFLSPGDLPNPGIEPMSPALQADPLPSELPGKPNYTEIPVSKQNAATETRNMPKLWLSLLLPANNHEHLSEYKRIGLSYSLLR